MTALLIIAALGDLGLAVLLVAVSGFVFGGGPEAGHDPSGTLAWAGTLAACLAAPIIGFNLRGKGKAGPGLAVALLPLVGALLLATGVIR